MKLLLIDGDITLYASTVVHEIETAWDDGDTWTLHTDLDAAKATLEATVSKLQAKYPTDATVLCLSGKGNWRLKYYPQYKHNRKSMRKPVGYKILKEWLKTKYSFMEKDGLEGDDLLGWLATSPKYQGSIIVSRDKDLSQIPGILYNDDKDIETNRTVLEADTFHMLQTIAGDPIDGYKGLPNFGMVKAKRFLDKYGPYNWKAIVKLYEAGGLDEAYAFSQAACSRILRYGDLNLETQELVWKPKL